MNIKKYICTDCDFMFYIRSKLKGKPFCPSCGDCVSTTSIEKKIERKPWTTLEEKLIDEIIAGKLQKYKVAADTGRTYGAIQRRVEKHKKRINKN